MAPDAIRVLLVDDHDVFRHGLAQLLADEGLAIAGEASGGEAGVRLAAELRPHVVLMDLAMPGISGVEATRAIAAAGGPPVVVLTLSDDDASMLEALLAGAAGYVPKDATLQQIVAAVQAAAAGEAVIPPRVAPELLRRLRAAEPSRAAGAHGGQAVELSERELEVLRLLVAGRDNAAIAAELFISPNTVKSHVASIFSKLGVESRLQASVQALRRGLVA